jgi:hypothetical protein
MWRLHQAPCISPHTLRLACLRHYLQCRFIAAMQRHPPQARTKRNSMTPVLRQVIDISLLMQVAPTSRMPLTEGFAVNCAL